MAIYDLEQQEQLDQYKRLWKQYGNLVIGVLIVAMLAYAGWSWYSRQQSDNAIKAAALYEELDRSVLQADIKKMTTVFQDMKVKYPGATYTAQAALLLAKVQADEGKDDHARVSLAWLVDNTKNPELRAVGRLRLASLLLDAKQYEPALTQLEQGVAEEFMPLANDRRGDILLAQGKKPQAIKAYQQAYQSFDKDNEYRRFVASKLIALGAAPASDL